MDIGSAIRHLRRQQGLTLQELCDAIGNDMQTGYLSRVETNKLNPSVYTVADIARALGTTVDDLLKGSNTFHAYKETKACRKIPVFPFVAAANPYAVGMYPPTTALTTIPSPVDVPLGSFGLILDDDSMQSSEGLSFSQGSVVIFAPYDKNRLIREKQIQLGQYVIVHSQNARPGSPPLFRQLVADGAERMLRPRNSRYPIRPLPPEPVFVGYAVVQILDLTS